MAKTHVIDGVTYEKVDREAVSGEKVIHSYFAEDYDSYPDIELDNVYECDCVESADSEFDVISLVGTTLRLYHREYRVLVPVTSPKRHEIDGVLYEEVERKAEVGEKIIAIAYYGDKRVVGEILTVIETGYEDGSIQTDNEFFDIAMGDEYRVLTPITPAPESDADVIASLVRRVFVLETEKKKDGALLIEAFSEMLRKRDKEIGELRELVEMLIDDTVTLDEWTQPTQLSETLGRELTRGELTR